MSCKYCQGCNNLHAEHPHLFDTADVGENKWIYGWIWRDSLQVVAKINGVEFAVRENIKFCPNCGASMTEQAAKKAMQKEGGE